MVGGRGLEPMPPSMSRKCSPAELTAPSFRKLGFYSVGVGRGQAGSPGPAPAGPGKPFSAVIHQAERHGRKHAAACRNPVSQGGSVGPVRHKPALGHLAPILAPTGEYDVSL